MTDYICPPEAVIFDMDGLLVDSEKLWKIAETALLADRGAQYSDEKHEPLIGMGMSDFIPGLKRTYELDDDLDALHDELIERIHKIIAEHDPETQPGALDIVDYVVEKKLPYAIASSSPLSLIHATIGSQPHWEGLFPVRTSAEEVPNGKPAPDVYLLAAERLGVDPTKCLALEDSPNGSRSAVAAGMTCFAVPDPSHSHPERFNGVTPHVFESLHDVLEKLKDC